MAAAPRGGVLVRDFIREALCGSGGYFSGASSPVLHSPKSLPFATFRGRADYTNAVAARYADGDGDFATPCELFAPWYSYCVARWAVAWHRREVFAAAAAGRARPPLVFLEFGGGAGTHAARALDFVAAEAPDFYGDCVYVGVDASAAMSERFLSALEARHGGRAFGVVADAGGDWALPGAVPAGATVTAVALELLDNLPHDKVLWGGDGAPREVRVVRGGAEVDAPVADPLIARACALAGAKRGVAEFLPTGALAFLSALGDRAPAHRLLVADFDALPRPAGADATARNAPLVAARERDLPSYLDAAGDADIFFATDFDFLKRAYVDLGLGRPGDVETPKCADFFRRDPLARNARTRSGYNPLLDDFANTSVLLAAPRDTPR